MLISKFTESGGGVEVATEILQRAEVEKLEKANIRTQKYSSLASFQAGTYLNKGSRLSDSPGQYLRGITTA